VRACHDEGEAILARYLSVPDQPALTAADPLPQIAVSKDKKSFVLEASGRPFVPWGFNYDHDEKGRLIEDYWEDEWPTVEAHLGQMKKLGANVVRVHWQLGKFMDGREKVVIGEVKLSTDRVPRRCSRGRRGQQGQDGPEHHGHPAGLFLEAPTLGPQGYPFATPGAVHTRIARVNRSNA
jgi:hypothetical protein